MSPERQPSPRKRYRGSPPPISRTRYSGTTTSVPDMADIPYRTRDRGPVPPPSHPTMMPKGLNEPERGFSRRRPRRDDEYISKDQARTPTRGRSTERSARQTYDRSHRVVHKEVPEQASDMENTVERVPSESQVQPKQLPAKYRRSRAGMEYQPSGGLSRHEVEKPRRYVTFVLPRYCTSRFFRVLIAENTRSPTMKSNSELYMRICSYYSTYLRASFHKSMTCKCKGNALRFPSLFLDSH